MIFQLVYTCALRNDVTDRDLADIAKTSAKLNKDRDITGMLICNDGSVLQILEGEQAIVEALYKDIQSDKRISNLIVLMRRSVESREFPEWSMGYANANETEAVFDLDASSWINAIQNSSSSEIQTISRTFARVNGVAFA